ncbi:MAG: DNA-directed RNA polymerase subunit omega [Candidatus Omnitrophica bacterium]|nr:DNA-directed RNA polymerase subunit omega [Candidatus Omnitrophota bacterium]
MTNIKPEELMKRVGSIYKLVILASKRTIELNDGKPKFVDVPPATRLALIALKEIQEGLVSYKVKEEKPEK